MTHEPPRAPGGSEHLDLDQLADLDEDLLTPADTTSADEHLASCDQCRQRRADLRSTQALLSTLPAEPMPPAIAARIDAALAALPSTTIVPLVSNRRGWRAHPTMAGLGAAATVAALVGALVVARAESHHSTSNGPGTAAAGTTPNRTALALPPSTVSGTSYTDHNLARTVPALLHPQQAPMLAQTPATPGPQTAAGTAKTSSAVPVALTRLFGSPSALDACVGAVEAGGSGPPVKPLAIDFATYQGAPAVLIVLPGLEAGSIDAWFVGPDCNPTDSHLIRYTSVPDSAGSPSPAG